MPNSLITSEFSKLPLSGIAYTSTALDTPILKFQPLNDALSENLSPLQLDNSSNPNKILWIDDQYFVVLYENKPYFDLIDSVNPSQIDQHVNLLISSNTSSCSCAVFNYSTNILYLLDSSNRLFIFSFDKFDSEKKISEISNFVITGLNESASQILVKDDETLLIISNSLYEFDIKSKTITKTLNMFVDISNCSQKIGDYLLASSANDRFINLIDLNTFKIKSICVLNSPIVKFAITKYKNKSILAAIDENGFVELFNDPLNKINSESNENDTQPASNLKRRKKVISSIKTIKPTTTLKLFEASSKDSVLNSIDNILFNNDQLVIAYLQNENYFIIDHFNWVKNNLNVTEIKIERKKSTFDHLKLQSQDIAATENYKESNDVVIRTGDNFMDLDPLVEPLKDQDEILAKEKQMEEDEEDEPNDDFSHLVSRLDENDSLKTKKQNKFQFKVGTLTTNLTQALRNNDNSMFYTIINNTTDENVVKNTISQLEQHSVLKILDKLAELIYKNKFKNTNESAEYGFGNSSIGLSTWIRYVLVYHGTYLISAANNNGDLRRRLGLLGMSMQNRAGNLNRLLELKSYLSMVSEKVSAVKEVEKLEMGEDIESDYEDEVEYIEEEEDLDDSDLEDSQPLNADIADEDEDMLSSDEE